MIPGLEYGPTGLTPNSCSFPTLSTQPLTAQQTVSWSGAEGRTFAFPGNPHPQLGAAPRENSAVRLVASDPHSRTEL